MPVIDGLASGIDTSAIIQGLLSIQQQRIDLLTSRQKALRTQQTAFATVESRLLVLRGTLARLASNTNSALSAKTVSSSDETLAVASGSTSAAPGTYSLTVHRLAQRHQVASNGFASATAEITQGTFTIHAGGFEPKAITIESTNNTLQGLADAVNAAGVGVTASIVSDGSGGPASYRLLLTSERSGTDFGISITNGLAVSGGSAVQPTFDFNNPVQAAQNARVTLGSGAGALTVENSTNRIDDLIAGVKIDLVSANPAKQVTLSVATDTEQASEAVSDFVKAYNDVIDFINAQSRFNPDTQTGGALLGNRSLISIQQDLQTTITNSVGGLASVANRLSALGITVGSDGKLALNSSKLTGVLNGTDGQVTVDAARRLFGIGADSTNSAIRFVLGSAKTKAGTVQVDITSAAEQAVLTGTKDISESITIDGTNNEFVLKLDGSDAVTVRLDHGTYTQTEFATAVQRAINTHSGLVGRSVSVAAANNRLTITSASYGRTSSISIQSGSALDTLGFNPGTTDIGQDVVGSFIVDGKAEKATGQGNLLIADAGNANTDGLQVRVTLKSNQLTAGPEATLNITRGVAAELDQELEDILNGQTGQLKTVNGSYDERVESLQKSIERLNAQFDARRESLVQQFIRLETNVSQFQTLGSYLSAQLGSLTIRR